MSTFVDGTPEIVGAHEIIFFFDRDVDDVIEIALRDLLTTTSVARAAIATRASSRALP